MKHNRFLHISSVLLTSCVSVSPDEGKLEVLDRPATAPTAVEASAAPSLSDEEGVLLSQSHSVPSEAALSSREQAVYSSVLTLRADSDTPPQALVQSLPSPPGNSDNRTNHKTLQEPSPGAPHAPTRVAQTNSALSTSSGTDTAACAGARNLTVICAQSVIKMLFLQTFC